MSNPHRLTLGYRDKVFRILEVLWKLKKINILVEVVLLAFYILHLKKKLYPLIPSLLKTQEISFVIKLLIQRAHICINLNFLLWYINKLYVVN